ncbi:MAG: HisA/HisF-related TIM barrel protein [Frankiaceae bacterium]
MTPAAPGGFVLLPAVDVAAGRVARLAGDGGGTDAGSGTDPVAIALRWQRAGAPWVHLADLDAAFGTGSNHALLARVVATLDVPVALSGGIRDDASLGAALATGCARVNLATDALRRPEWVEAVVAAHGERVAVCLDVRDGRLAARGAPWEGGDVADAVRRLDAAGCRRYVVTDAQRDGSLAGPDLGLLRAVSAATDSLVIASGGVATLDDLRALAALRGVGVEGAIVGRALHAGAFTLPEALAALVASAAAASPGCE